MPLLFLFHRALDRTDWKKRSFVETKDPTAMLVYKEKYLQV